VKPARSARSIPVDIAAAKALAAAVPVAGTETLDLLAANVRVLAGDLVAALNLPPFDASAMDGYAVKAD
jgi:molybdopterin molybdotransferase